MTYTNFIRGLVKKNSNLKADLRKAGSKQSPFQYMNQTVVMTMMSVIAISIIVFLFFKNSILHLVFFEILVFMLFPFLMFKFWNSYVQVLIRKYGREIDSDLLFVSEFFLVTLESGMPLGNAIQRLSHLDRPGGKFFKRVYTDFTTGKSLELALQEATIYAPTNSSKTLLKRLRDSLQIGVDLRDVLSNFVEEASQKKIVEIGAYSKKLNPFVMMYLLLGIVLPSIGVTFFILGAAILNLTPEFLKFVLIFIFLIMFAFQYFFYSSLKFGKATI